MFGKSLLDRKRAAIYVRVSTITQVKEGHGLEIQEGICRDYCDLKRFDVHEVYSDPGVSGTTKPIDRPGLSKLLEDAKQKQFNAIVFGSLDRIAREIIITFEIINLLKQYDIEIISCKEEIDTTTYQGKFKLSIYAAVNELELGTIKARLTMGRDMKGLKDGDVGGRMPYGYIRLGGEINPNPNILHVILFIFEQFDDGTSMNRIATVLNNNNVPTQRGGKKWYGSTIKSILSNRSKYEGGLIGNNVNDIRWPKLLS